MSIRRNYDTFDRRQRKIDQHFEMAGLARQDGDTVDAARHLAEARRLQQGGDLDGEDTRR